MDPLFPALSLIKHLASEKMSILNTEKKRSIFMAPLLFILGVMSINANKKLS